MRHRYYQAQILHRGGSVNPAQMRAVTDIALQYGLKPLAKDMLPKLGKVIIPAGLAAAAAYFLGKRKASSAAPASDPQTQVLPTPVEAKPAEIAVERAKDILENVARPVTQQITQQPAARQPVSRPSQDQFISMETLYSGNGVKLSKKSKKLIKKLAEGSGLMRF